MYDFLMHDLLYNLQVIISQIQKNRAKFVVVFQAVALSSSIRVIILPFFIGEEEFVLAPI